MSDLDLNERLLRVQRALNEVRRGRLKERSVRVAALRAMDGLNRLEHVATIQRIQSALPEHLRLPRYCGEASHWSRVMPRTEVSVDALSAMVGGVWESRSDAMVRNTALSALAPPRWWRPAVGEPEEDLAWSLKSQEPWLRLSAIAPLTREAGRRAWTAVLLEGALDDPEVLVRDWAALALARMGHVAQPVAPQVAERLTHAPHQRCVAAWILSEIGGDRESDPSVSSASSAVRDVVVSLDVPLGTRAAALDLLAQIDGDCWRLALEIFLGGGPMMLAGAAALRTLRGQAVPAVPTLLAALDGPKKADVLTLLQAMALAEAAPALSLRLRRLPAAPQDDVREEAEQIIATLGAIGAAAAPAADAVVMRLREGLRGCVEALRAMGPGAALPLTALLEDGVAPEVATSALEALAGMSEAAPQTAVAAAPWLAHPSVAMRRLAAAICIRSEDTELAARAAAKFAEDCEREGGASGVHYFVNRAVARAAAALLECEVLEARIAGAQALGWTREHGERYLPVLSELSLNAPDLALQAAAEESWWRLELPVLPFKRRRRRRQR